MHNHLRTQQENPFIAGLKRTQKRGRPRLSRPAQDCGTPELAAKRLAGITEEPLDRAFRQCWISSPQHEAGLRLRWLYTLRHGAPTVQGIDWSRFYGESGSATARDPEWRIAREREYAQMTAGLARAGCRAVVEDVCIFSRWPKFLILAGLRQAAEAEHHLHGRAKEECRFFRAGLELLTLRRPK